MPILSLHSPHGIYFWLLLETGRWGRWTPSLTQHGHSSQYFWLRTAAWACDLLLELPALAETGDIYAHKRKRRLHTFSRMAAKGISLCAVRTPQCDTAQKTPALRFLWSVLSSQEEQSWGTKAS